jgi:hypothetical protein
MLPIEERVKLLTSISDRAEALRIIGLFLAELEKGGRCARRERNEDGVWKANGWVKEGILSAFASASSARVRLGRAFLHRQGHHSRRAASRSRTATRIVPGGSSIAAAPMSPKAW